MKDGLGTWDKVLPGISDHSGQCCVWVCMSVPFVRTGECPVAGGPARDTETHSPQACEEAAWSQREGVLPVLALGGLGKRSNVTFHLNAEPPAGSPTSQPLSS